MSASPQIRRAEPYATVVVPHVHRLSRMSHDNTVVAVVVDVPTSLGRTHATTAPPCADRAHTGDGFA